MEAMAKKAQRKTSTSVRKLGRSALTGKYVLEPVAKKGGKASLARVREVVREVIREAVLGKKA
jgi:hypothetical protein